MDRLELDYTHALAEVVGEGRGVSEQRLAGLAERLAGALAAVRARRGRDLRWLELPHRSETGEAVLEFASRVRGRFENVVVLGIGGSALGNLALHAALSSPYHDQQPPPGMPRLFVLDNIDPDLVGEWLDRFDPSKTLFNVISKSGGTAETMSQFLVFRNALIERLGEEAHREHIVATTDASTGSLRAIVEREGYESFVVPEGVGGRFSVLSPVGLLSSALVGIDVKGLLAGAADMDRRCENDDLFANPAAMYAALQWCLDVELSLPMSVTFCYSHRLRWMADWYAQLLGESLGKRLSRTGEVIHAGPTPIRAVGVTDQHSQVQLYVEGPFDKWFTFLTVAQHDHTVPIPPAYEDLAGVAYLGGHTLAELFAAEREGTRIALTRAGRPSCTITLPRVDAHAVGQYLFLMELAVALMGELYDVNAFDQPGVEAGKVAAYALMGREGYEEERARIESSAPARRYTC